MPASIRVICPECDKEIQAPGSVEGKKIRCKGCGEIFVARSSSIASAPTDGKKKREVPSPARPESRRKTSPKPKIEELDEVEELDELAVPSKGKPKKGKEDELDEIALPSKSKPKKAKVEAQDDDVASITEETPGIIAFKDDEEDDGAAYEATTLDLAPRCPNCANELEYEGAVICLHCGYNTRTRLLAQTRKTYDQTALDYFIWWLPAILCVLGIIFLIVWDILYCLYAEGWFEDAWYEMAAHFAVKLWMVIGSIFAMYYMGKYAFKRFVFETHPPEVEKK